MLQAREHALTLSPFTVFFFGLVAKSIKELGGCVSLFEISTEELMLTH
jgi:hypothetical protein